MKQAAGGTDGAKQHFIGSDKDMVSYCDAAGVTHKEDSLNTVLKVQFRKKAVLLNRAGMDQEFGVKLCKPPMVSIHSASLRWFLLCTGGHGSRCAISQTTQIMQMLPRQRTGYQTTTAKG